MTCSNGSSVAPMTHDIILQSQPLKILDDGLRLTRGYLFSNTVQGQEGSVHLTANPLVAIDNSIVTEPTKTMRTTITMTLRI